MKKMSLPLLVLNLMFLPIAYGTDIYRCEINGKTVFAEQPCTDKAQKLDLDNVGSVISKQTVVTSESSTKREATSDYIERRKIEREIHALERERDNVGLETKKQIKQLQNDKKYASNNLAGATWQQGLAEEMSAISAAADTQIKSINEQIKILNEQLARLINEKPHGN